MKVLVLGGTGAIGDPLVRNLVKDKHNVYVTSRRFREGRSDVKYIHGNAKDNLFLTKVLNEHWDAIIDFMVYSTNEFAGKVNLLLSKTDQYIFLSSARVYADSLDRITELSDRLLDVTEDKEFISTDEYSLAKARQENILLKSKYRNWTIIRPYITYNSDRLQLGVLEKEEWLYRALHGRSIIFSSDMIVKNTTMTYGYDVSKGIQAIIGNKKSFGEVFQITATESITWGKVLSIYLEVIKKKTGQTPNVLLLNKDKYMRLHHGKYQLAYDRFYDRQFNSNKIAKFIDTDSFVRSENGLKNCLEKFLEYPMFKKINWKLEALNDKQINEITPIREIREMKQIVVYITFRYLPDRIIKMFRLYP